MCLCVCVCVCALVFDLRGMENDKKKKKAAAMQNMSTKAKRVLFCCFTYMHIFPAVADPICVLDLVRCVYEDVLRCLVYCVWWVDGEDVKCHWSDQLQDKQSAGETVAAVGMHRNISRDRLVETFLWVLCQLPWEFNAESPMWLVKLSMLLLYLHR